MKHTNRSSEEGTGRVYVTRHASQAHAAGSPSYDSFVFLLPPAPRPATRSPRPLMSSSPAQVPCKLRVSRGWRRGCGWSRRATPASESSARCARAHTHMTHAQARTHARTHAHMHKHARTHARTHAHMHKHARTHARARARAHTRTRVHTHRHTRARAHTAFWDAGGEQL